METIKSSTEVSYLFTHGKRLSTPFATLIVLRNAEQHGQAGRVAFVAGKKLGNAVWRNRAKRRMRAICRELGGPWPDYDVIFLAKRQTTQAKYSKVLGACEKALSGAGFQTSQ
ncbi:ribonuclease P protein component [Raoultibacter phocaeensis]|uniref:ribonuclease P protein component n=1 Tax=Raoultibacter phocaeensis TaxID=2479841 RepID=UPI00111AFAE3